MTTDDGIVDLIGRHVVLVVPEIPRSACTSDRTLTELGCNSIDRAEIVAMVMEKRGVTVPLDEFTPALTLADLAALFRHYT